jgi:hypothetical protein
MSRQEEQSLQNQNENQNQNQNIASQGAPDHHHHERFNDLMMLASVQLPVSRNQMLLDYLYGNNIPIVPVRLDFAAAGGGGGIAGGIFDGLYDIESSAASILARSLYDCCPVKRVISDEARCQIVDKQFTSAMVEELKINEACGIWQEDFEEGEAIKILPCNHAFKAEAIIKWLEEEKAECPICRSALESKEVIQNQAPSQEQPPVHANAEEEPAPEVQQNNDGIRVNNIASRLAQSVAGRANQYHHRSISVPMNRLIQSVRMASSSVRSHEPPRATITSSSGAAANAVHEVSAEAMQHYPATVPAPVPASAPVPAPVPAPAYNNIINNNYYYLNNLRNLNDLNNPNDLNAINYFNYLIRNNNNNNNYHEDHEDHEEDEDDEDDEDDILNQEQADIEEAIRRSLQ